MSYSHVGLVHGEECFSAASRPQLAVDARACRPARPHGLHADSVSVRGFCHGHMNNVRGQKFLMTLHVAASTDGRTDIETFVTAA